MANETTTTSLTVNVPTEFIEATLLEALRPNIVVAPLVQGEILGEGKGVVWQQTKLPTATASGLTEASDQNPTTRTTTREANITVAGVGLNTEITDLAKLATVGQAAELGKWAQESGKAIAVKIDGDLCALFAGLNASTAVGATGVDLTVANFIEAIYTMENANVHSPLSCVLHAIQKYDLMTALVNSSNAGALHTNLAELVREGRLPQGQPSNGFWGVFCGVPIYITTEVDTANSAADRAGAMFAREAMAFVQLAPVTVEYDRDSSKRTTEVVATTFYGVGENDEHRGVPIVTDA